jgi:hypothetical protein
LWADRLSSAKASAGERASGGLITLELYVTRAFCLELLAGVTVLLPGLRALSMCQLDQDLDHINISFIALLA